MSAAPKTAAAEGTGKDSVSASSQVEPPPWESPQWQEAVSQNPGLASFFDNLESFVELPEGVEKLRALVLGLAVRGQLLDQDANDEPAEDLLGRIEEQRQKLIASGELRKPKKETKLTEKEIPFSLPVGWAWSKLEPLMLKMGAGSTPLGGKKVYVDEGVMFLRSQNVWNDGLRLTDVARILPETHAKMSGTHVFGGDVLLNITGASIGRCALVPDEFDDANVSQHVAILRLIDKDLRAFLQLCVVSPFFQDTIMRVQVGVSREGLSMTRLKAFPFPVPPLAEQRRIVSKVEGLMSLCDTLESQRRARESVRERASRSVLVRLTSAPVHPPALADPDQARPVLEPQASCATGYASAATESKACSRSTGKASGTHRGSSGETLQSSWQRLSDHFEVLLDQPETLAHLRQSILQLAVQGKLVPQDPSDEPASEMLRTVTNRRAELMKAGKVNMVKKSPDIEDDEKPFDDIPDSWVWVRVTDVFDVSGGITKNPKRKPVKNHYPYLRVANVQRGRLELDEISRFELFDDDLERWRLEPNDLLVVEGNGSEKEIGRCAIWSGEIEDCVHQNHLIRCRPIAHEAQTFTLKFFNSPAGMDGMKKRAITTSGLYSLSVGKIRSLVIPLPPKAEQKRIVSKVSVLLSQLDELSARLRSRQSTTDALLTALIHQILNGADER